MESFHAEYEKVYPRQAAVEIPAPTKASRKKARATPPVPPPPPVQHTPAQEAVLAKINIAENLLRFSKSGDDTDALVFWGEDKVKRRVSHGELHDRVAGLAAHFRGIGLKVGDRVAGFVPNMPESIIGAFATASLGCVWSSCSPDFGVRGVLDRFGQIEPRVLITADGYWYNGKSHDCLERVREILAKLPSVEEVLVIPYLSQHPDISKVPNARLIDDVIAANKGAALTYERVEFNHPLYIMFSSGTTGVPKCIVHGQGGTLLQHLKEHRLHSDVKPHDRVFYFTTCGWMMWNWLISGLGSGATLLLYDGSPFAPNGNILWDFAQAERCTFFGTSAKYIDACLKAEINPMKTHDLSTLRGIGSTGSPLVPAGTPTSKPFMIHSLLGAPSNPEHQISVASPKKCSYQGSAKLSGPCTSLRTRPREKA